MKPLSAKPSRKKEPGASAELRRIQTIAGSMEDEVEDQEDLAPIPSLDDVKYWACRRSLIILGMSVDEAIDCLRKNNVDEVFKELFTKPPQ